MSSLKDRERSGGPRRFDTEPLLQIYSGTMRAKKEHEFTCQFFHVWPPDEQREDNVRFNKAGETIKWLAHWFLEVMPALWTREGPRVTSEDGGCGRSGRRKYLNEIFKTQRRSHSSPPVNPAPFASTT